MNYKNNFQIQAEEREAIWLLLVRNTQPILEIFNQSLIALLPYKFHEYGIGPARIFRRDNNHETFLLILRISSHRVDVYE